jgi:hypothetical protein
LSRFPCKRVFPCWERLGSPGCAQARIIQTCPLPREQQLVVAIGRARVVPALQLWGRCWQLTISKGCVSFEPHGVQSDLFMWGESKPTVMNWAWGSNPLNSGPV